MNDADIIPGGGACERQAEGLSLLAAGCLEPAAEPPIRRHLAVCPECAARFADLSRLARDLEAAAADPRPHVAAIRERSAARPGRGATAPRPRSPRGVRAARWLVAGAAAAACLWFATPPTTVRPAPRPVAASRPGSAGSRLVVHEAPLEPVGSPAVSRTLARPDGAALLAASELASADSDAGFDAVLSRRIGSVAWHASPPPSLFRVFAEEFSR
jgi:hypothetical protein